MCIIIIMCDKPKKKTLHCSFSIAICDPIFEKKRKIIIPLLLKPTKFELFFFNLMFASLQTKKKTFPHKQNQKITVENVVGLVVRFQHGIIRMITSIDLMTVPSINAANASSYKINAYSNSVRISEHFIILWNIEIYLSIILPNIWQHGHWT